VRDGDGAALLDLALALLAKETPDDLRPIELEVRAHFREDGRECADPKSLVVGDRKMVLPTIGGREPEMAPGFPCDLIAERL
jgi:hypothetical protein